MNLAAAVSSVIVVCFCTDTVRFNRSASEWFNHVVCVMDA